MRQAIFLTPMIKKYTFHELREIFDEIILIPERLNGLDIVELKELYFHLVERKSNLFRTAVGMLNANPDYKYPKNCDALEYWKANTTQYGLSVSDLEYWSAILLKGINKDSKSTSFNDRIFKNAESEHFFAALFDNWLNEKGLTVVALQYVYRKMSHKTLDDVDETINRIKTYTIVATHTDFAKYWNDSYRPLHPENLGFRMKANNRVSIKTFGEMAPSSIDGFHTRLNSVINKFS